LPQKYVWYRSSPFGEVSELAEGARLEIVCTGDGTVGSNPTLSAILIANGMIAMAIRLGSRAA
jgi:hypothetical protein